MDSLLTAATGPETLGHWIRLRTLVLLRWWAVSGQIAALVIGHLAFDLVFDVGLCFLVIGASVISNLAVSLVYPATKRLNEPENLLFVMFDLVQLGLMLYLTGGLNNPFSILVVGPVIVSASSLSARSTIFLGLTAIAIVTVLLWFNVPLQTAQGFELIMPELFRVGFWFALVIAVIFLGVYSRWVVSEMHAMSDALQATQMALAREQKLTDLGGVVAAAAHELGTPLATIKLTSSELADDLPDGSDAREDALLIREQADRCRDILRSMGRAGKDDLHLRHTPLGALVEEAAEPHMNRGKTVLVEHRADDATGQQPMVQRRSEIIHGLRNLIQNAVDFAADTVWVESRWDADRITLRIMDNGPGYPPHMLGRIGDPFMRRRAMPSDWLRPEYEGMGLGLFIAKTLLERSGADLSFANGVDSFAAGHRKSARSGAFVEVSWPRDRLEAEPDQARAALGENQPISR
ncbi:sensor histidine kinase RegB [Roseovarius nubinhibens]|uniref:histidine kinase n=1 Tax=Roseovarius nubinhibens (strain ATCC BAA-591 / DSM 15170 / ISM) TaxID=89187 RepID=A3SKW2_ROSNI|nr:ActS/PrrB/RegB family redox-sensitive histidine kinase [Roseovarius nubinhibens]EAP77993.1 sensor histidine kinase RegB [Roseovarius nubinhibens ISM]